MEGIRRNSEKAQKEMNILRQMVATQSPVESPLGVNNFKTIIERQTEEYSKKGKERAKKIINNG